MTRSDWADVLSRAQLDVSALDGHFVIVRWKDDDLEFFTDQLGLRTLYWARSEGGMCISTRLDWVTAASGKTELDLHALGSRWLLFNQMSYASCVKEVGRLGPGGAATFRAGSLINVATRPWLPQAEPCTPSEALEIAGAFVDCALDHPLTPTLGLSGGLDSRLLLARLIKSGQSRFATYTIGNPADPDVRVANEIASALALPHQHLNEPLPDPSESLKGVRSYVAQSHLVEPASTWAKLRYYPTLREQGRLVIDGGYGEFGRRQFFNRVVRLGRSAVAARDSGRLMRLVRSRRADVFAPEVTEALEKGARETLQESLDAMPAHGLGAGDFVDLFAVRLRIPNSGGPEQVRQDSEILNFMPLAQPSYLRAVLAVPARVRANGRIYTDAIGLWEPRLTRFPRVKGGTTISARLPSNLAWAVVKAKSLAGKTYRDTRPDDLLTRLREFVLDVVHSKGVADCGMYDHQKVIGAVDRYYRGDGLGQAAVDWWLTFELWRQALIIPPTTREP